MQRTNWWFLSLLALAAPGPVEAAKIRVATSTTDLASIASTVGGDRVEAFAIARPNADVHRVEILPSYMVKVARADLYLKIGLGLDLWADGIIDGSRNAKLLVVDCSRRVVPLDKPKQVTLLMGDVHPLGNPHYWLDPRNGALVAQEIAEALAHRDPANAAEYEARAQAFAREVEETYAHQREIAGTIPGKVLLTYHASWIYLADAFGMRIAGTAEPVPGIPPTARHLAELVAVAKERGITVLLQEPYFSDDAGAFLAREAGVRTVKVSPSCDDAKAGSYLRHIDDVLHRLASPTGAHGKP